MTNLRNKYKNSRVRIDMLLRDEEAFVMRTLADSYVPLFEKKYLFWPIISSACPSTMKVPIAK